MADFHYKGFSGSLEFQPDACYFFGAVKLRRDLVHYEGRSISELESNFKTSVDKYLEDCAALGIEPG